MTIGINQNKNMTRNVMASTTNQKKNMKRKVMVASVNQGKNTKWRVMVVGVNQKKNMKRKVMVASINLNFEPWNGNQFFQPNVPILIIKSTQEVGLGLVTSFFHIVKSGDQFSHLVLKPYLNPNSSSKLVLESQASSTQVLNAQNQNYLSLINSVGYSHNIENKLLRN